MNYFNFEKKHCPLCGHLLERYPNNGAPIINEGVCLDCNNKIILLTDISLPLIKSIQTQCSLVMGG